jgi:hypothetical protein
VYSRFRALSCVLCCGVTVAASAPLGLILPDGLLAARGKAVTLRAGVARTDDFARKLAASGDLEAQSMLGEAMALWVEGVAAIERRDPTEAHRLLDKCDGVFERLAGYCQARQRELAPTEAAEVEAHESKRIDSLAQAMPAAQAALIRERQQRISAHRKHFERRTFDLSRVPLCTPSVTVVLARDRAPAARRTHSPPARAKPRPSDDDPPLARLGRAVRHARRAGR